MIRWSDKPCKVYQGSKNWAGYGKCVFQGRYYQYHRLEWEKHYGPIPKGLYILHRCDNRPCYEITHLFVGTQKDNIKDMFDKGRAHQQNKTHCAKGHEFNDKNTHIDKRGHRKCRPCHAEWRRIARARLTHV